MACRQVPRSARAAASLCPDGVSAEIDGYTPIRARTGMDRPSTSAVCCAERPSYRCPRPVRVARSVVARVVMWAVTVAFRRRLEPDGYFVGSLSSLGRWARCGVTAAQQASTCPNSAANSATRRPRCGAQPDAQRSPSASAASDAEREPAGGVIGRARRRRWPLSYSQGWGGRRARGRMQVPS
jgi:hypothetical protein